jgi:hypothetical protein
MTPGSRRDAVAAVPAVPAVAAVTAVTAVAAVAAGKPISSIAYEHVSMAGKIRTPSILPTRQ